MKKVGSILALAVLSLGVFSCEAENNIEETQALYEVDINATEGEEPTGSEGRGGDGS